MQKKLNNYTFFRAKKTERLIFRFNNLYILLKKINQLQFNSHFKQSKRN